MKIKVTKTGITDHNAIVEVDQVVDYAEADAKRLIAAGYAVAVEEPEDDLAKKLEKKYKADELIAKAKELGMEVADGTTKKDLIAAIVAAGKAEDFLV